MVMNARTERYPERGAMYRSRILILVVFVGLIASGRAQQAASMEPSIELVLLGTGYPYPSGDRAGPSCAVIVGDDVFIVDAGRGVGMRIAAAGIPWDGIRGVFITHLHSDHYDGLPDLFHSTWQFGNGLPFELYGPEGIRKLADGILQFYEPDIHIRRDLTEKLPPEGARINTHPVEEGVVLDIPGKVRITAFVEDHKPVIPAFGYRFDAGSKSIVVTGDTRPNPNLVRFARGADILVHEAYVGGNASSGGNGGRPWSIRDYHSSAAEAGRTAQEAGAKTLVLTHLMPGNAPERYFLEEARKTFGGKILVGRDLLRVQP
jgi:ribonuclease BN (tRNA processing enzyme)